MNPEVATATASAQLSKGAPPPIPLVGCVMACRQILRQLVVLPIAVFVSSCSLLPSEREEEWSRQQLSRAVGVMDVTMSCNGDFLATSKLCADVRLEDGTLMTFYGVGYRAFGPSADTVGVAELAGRFPYIATCAFRDPGHKQRLQGWKTAADFHASKLFGRHVQPPIRDILDAVERAPDVLAALEHWPSCPDFWEFEDQSAGNVRYCSSETGARFQRPPVHPECQR